MKNLIFLTLGLALSMQLWASPVPNNCSDGAAVCVDGPGTKFINGIEVYRECWNWQRTRECRSESNVNYCAALDQHSGCSEIGRKCLLTSLAGACLKEERTYQCGDAVNVENVELVDYTHTVVDDKNTQACSSFLDNPNCYQAGSRCVEGPATKIINGVAVFKQCWKEEIDWACASEGVSNSCGTLVAAGCEPVGDPVCTEMAADGSCARYTRTFRCVNSGPITGPDISGTPGTEPGFDTLSCENATAGMNCTLIASECTEPGGDRVIDGVTVSAPCWLEEKKYRCTEVTQENSCNTLENTPGCTLETSKCIERVGARCVAYEKTIRCQSTEPIHPPEPEVNVEDQVTVVGPMQWNSTCRPFETNPQCQIDSKTCTEFDETDPEKCLKWQTTYLCQAEGGFTSNCNALEANEKCTLVAEECLAVNAEGACLTEAFTYRCEEKEGTTTETTVCRPAECLPGLCDGTGDPADTDFSSVLTWLETLRQGAVYGDLDGNQFFAGKSDECSKKVLGFSCCDEKVKAGGANSDAFGKVLSFAGEATVETVKYLGSPYVYDALAGSEATSGLLTMLYGNATSGVYNPSLSFYGFGMTLQGGQMYFTFNPGVFAATVAFQIAMDFLQCDTAEQALMLKKGQNLCTYVGTYCSLDLGLGCIERKESYCCFNSRLARILNEQGKAQLGKPMGTAKNPICSGFTLKELEMLDFNAMDLSDFSAEILKDAQLNVDAVTDRTESHVSHMSGNNLGGYVTPPAGSSNVLNPGYTGNKPVLPPPSNRIKK